MSGRHTHVYTIRGRDGGPDSFEVVCDEHELSELYADRGDAELAAGDHDDARHSE